MTNDVEEEEEDDAICRTKWYRRFHFEFGVFSVENFSKVIFLMDYSYTYPIKDGMFTCIFYEYGNIFLIRNQLKKTNFSLRNKSNFRRTIFESNWWKTYL